MKNKLRSFKTNNKVLKKIQKANKDINYLKDELKSNEVTKIIIIDSIPGTGKSSLVPYIIESEDSKIVHVTERLSENKRLKDNFDNIILPDNEKTTKLSDFNSKIEDGYNISITHNLFKRFNEITKFALLRRKKHTKTTLIIDEVFEPIEMLNIKLTDKDKIVLFKEYIKVDKDTGLVKLKDTDIENDSEVFKEILELAKSESLLYNSGCFIKVFNIDYLKMFNKIIIMTDDFRGSSLYYYLESRGFMFVYKTIKNGKVCDYSIKHLKNKINNEKQLVNLYDGIENYDYKKEAINKYDLSASFINKSSLDECNDILKSCRRYCKEIGIKTKESLLSCSDNFLEKVGKEKEKKLGSKIVKYKELYGFKNRIPTNCKGINDYRELNTVIIAYNLFDNPILEKAMKVLCKNYNIDRIVLNKMKQVIYRSRIRDGKTINLFIPSKRMRDIYERYLNNEFIDEKESIVNQIQYNLYKYKDHKTILKQKRSKDLINELAIINRYIDIDAKSITDDNLRLIALSLDKAVKYDIKKCKISFLKRSAS